MAITGQTILNDILIDPHPGFSKTSGEKFQQRDNIMRTLAQSYTISDKATPKLAFMVGYRMAIRDAFRLVNFIRGEGTDKHLLKIDFADNADELFNEKTILDRLT